MTEKFTFRRQDQAAIENSDQAELEAILKGSVIADQGVYDNRVADAMDDYQPDPSLETADWHKQDLAIDSAVGDVLEEVQRRAALMGSAYPFLIEKGQLTYRPSRSGFYEFCLAISLADQITAGRHAHFPRIFERMSAVLVKQYLGNEARALHVGTPRDQAVGKMFRKAMKHAQNETREWFWNPQPDLPEEPRDAGDHGVDFIVWKRPPDTRLGSLFIVGQCACGDDWTGKFNDVDLNRYGKWFNPLSYVPPTRAFTTPHHIADGWLHEALRIAGLVFDRARLTALAEQACEGTEYQSAMANIVALTRLVVPVPNVA